MSNKAGDFDLRAPQAVKAQGKKTVPPLYWGVFFALSCGLLFILAAGVAPALKTAADAGCRAMEPQVIDRPAPDLVFEDLQGNKVSVRNANAFLVLNFWATWCEPCLDEWPDLDRLAERVGERQDIEVWAVSIDEDREAVRRFLKEHKLEGGHVRVLFDPTHKAHEAFGSDKIPDTYFVTPQGQLTNVFVNTRHWGKPEAQRCVEASADRSAS